MPITDIVSANLDGSSVCPHAAGVHKPSLRHKLDPLDREILERAFQATLPAVQRNDSPVDFDSDEGLEAILRRELIEIACFNGVSDPETLRDILLARLPPVRQAPQTG